MQKAGAISDSGLLLLTAFRRLRLGRRLALDHRGVGVRLRVLLLDVLSGDCAAGAAAIATFRSHSAYLISQFAESTALAARFFR